MLNVLVVIHDRSVGESPACVSLLGQERENVRILIYDNSDSDFGIRESCEENGWTYLGGEGNRGLPAAYNAALDHVAAEDPSGHLCLLDDDTSLPRTFLEDMEKETAAWPDTILLPILLQDEKILSPWTEKRTVSFFSSVEECMAADPKDLYAFNSGMILPPGVVTAYRYDERLFLDCVDYSFLDTMKRRSMPVRVVPVECEQLFSGAEKPIAEKAMARFAIYVRDMRIYYENDKTAGEARLLKRALHLALLYRTARPFALLVKKPDREQ